MKDSSSVKSKILGLPLGTASNRLRKLLLFSLAGKLNMLQCFRCNKLIDNVAEFSIEHKIAWQNSETPNDLFFAIDNIAFSHLSCNIGAAYKHKKYASEKEKSRISFGKYYSTHKEQVLDRKRKRYHANKDQSQVLR